jgi:hypothetical protein
MFCLVFLMESEGKNRFIDLRGRLYFFNCLLCVLKGRFLRDMQRCLVSIKAASFIHLALPLDFEFRLQIIVSLLHKLSVSGKLQPDFCFIYLGQFNFNWLC